MSRQTSAAARMWFSGAVPPAVGHYVRAVLVRYVEKRDFANVWPLLSLMYGLDEEPPKTFNGVELEAKGNPGQAVRILTDWARRQATPSAINELSVVMPDADRVARWLRTRVTRPEYKSIFAEDLETLLVLAQAADLAETTAAWRAKDPKRLPLPVLLFGETGTGKELLARAMHEIHMRALASSANWRGQDAEASFGPINCGGLPANLIESELFGHVKGAFTGAIASRPGIIVEHSKGTVFLDEIGDTPPEVQLRLLRFLNDGEVRAVGANRPRYEYPWVIGATHRDLSKHVGEGKFREDLFNRLNGHILALKPLRARGTDVFGALHACLTRHAGTQLQVSISAPAAQAIRSDVWGANLRLVDQLARRLVQERAPSDHLSIELGDLPPHFQLQYLASTPYATRLVHQYIDEARTLSTDEREATRLSLIRHYRGAIEQGHVPEVRFVRTAAKFAATEIVRKLVEDEGTHAKIVAAARALQERTARQHERHLEKELFAVDGLTPPSKEPPQELLPNLPPWARKVFSIVEELSLNPDAWTQVRKLEAIVDRFTPSLRAALTELVAMLVEDARKVEPLPTVVDTDDHVDWNTVRKDKALFAKHLNEAGSAERMASEFGVVEKTIRNCAARFGIKLPNAR